MTISMGRLTLTENRRKRPRWILFTYQSIEFNSSSISNRLARWCEMITELELTSYYETGRQNDKSARGDKVGHSTAHSSFGDTFDT